VFADSITPNTDTNMIKREGESVTLSCTYDASSIYVMLYWYRQYPNREPQYLLWKGARSYGGQDITDQRFQSTTSQSSTELTIAGCQSDDTVDQLVKHVIKFEGESVTLDCKYTTTSQSQELFWYIQRRDKTPKLVLQRNSYGGGINGTEFQERFSSEVKPSKSVPLIIQRLHVSDSAVYYCALRPTVLTGCLSLIQNQKKPTVYRGERG
ncbi:hypothetical protein QQF64_015186, partial [Cirrhinus molitorella]